MGKSKDAILTKPDPKRSEKAIEHVVHEYSSLVWTAWASGQHDRYEDIARMHIAFSYFLPHRAFADFFSDRRFVPDKRLVDTDIDIQAVDFPTILSTEESRGITGSPT